MDKTFVGLAILLILGNLLSFAAEGAKGLVTTTLALPLTASSTTATVTSTANFRTAGQLIIAEEIINYSGVTATTFTGLGRGAEDTTPASASIGTTVQESTLGLIVNMLDFKAAQSDVPVFGPLITGFNVGGQFVQFVGRVIIWDYSFFDGDVMGVPMRIFQVLFFGLSVGVVLRLFVILRSGSSVL